MNENQTIPGLLPSPGGLFLNPKSQFRSILEGLRLTNVDIFYGHLEYCTDIEIFNDHLVHFLFIWYIFCSFGTFFVHLVHFFPVLVS
jgi:hypothetical protein